MRRAGILMVAIAAMVLVTGCPFESSVPLGSPGPGSLDPRLQGRWIGVEAGANAGEASFLPFNQAEYYVELRDKDKEPDRYRAYTVRIGGESFLNYNEIKSDSAGPVFSFARYTFDQDGALVLRFVGGKSVPAELGKNQKALVKFLAAHLEGALLDDTEAPTIMRRAAAPPKKEDR